MPTHSLYCTFLLCLLLNNEVHAQTLHFDDFREVSPYVFALHQDREGFLWVGSGEGLYRYDGYRFKKYTHIPGDTTSLTRSNIQVIYEDRAGTLWFASSIEETLEEGNLNRYNPLTDSFIRYKSAPNEPGSLRNPVATAIHEDRTGRFWIGTRHDGLYWLDKETGVYSRPDLYPTALTQLQDMWIEDIYEDQHNIVWVGTEQGLGQIDPDTKNVVFFEHDPDNPASIGQGAVLAILSDSKNRFWIGLGGGGLCRMDNNQSFSCFTHDPLDPASLSDNQVRAIVEDASGHLWIGTEVTTGSGGLNRFDPETGRFERFQHDQFTTTSLNSNNITTLFQDRSNALFIGTWGGGLEKLDYTAPVFSSYLAPVHDRMAWSVTEDRSGRLWIASRDGIHWFDRNREQWHSFVHDPTDPTSLSQGVIRGIYEDREGVMWIATGNGLDRFDEELGVFTHFRHDPKDPNSISGNVLQRMYEDSVGQFWIATRDGGLNRMDRETGRFEQFVHDPSDTTSIGRGIVHEFLEDSQGRFWISTSSGGLSLMDRDSGTFTHFKHDPNNPYSFSSNDLLSLVENEDGTIWVGAFNGGLNLFDPETGRVRRFNTKNSCLPHDAVLGILTDDEGFLWLNTNRGIVRFDPRQGTCTTYDTDFGLVSLAACLGSHKSASGEFFFGTFGGVHGFFPSEIPVGIEQPPVVLTEFRLSNSLVVPGEDSPLIHRIIDTEQIVLDASQNNIGFEFAVLNFSRPEQNQYAYILEGFDEDWFYSGNQNAATYTSLEPGSYTFRVKGATPDGNWNEEGASVHVVIKPPLWFTSWAYIGYGILFILGVVSVDRFQRRQLIRKEQERLQERELQKAREIEVINNQLIQHERQLEEKNEQLLIQRDQLQIQAQRLIELDQAKRRFFTNLSHEIRTPLTLILGPVDGALKGAYGPISAPIDVFLGGVRLQAQRLLDLVNQLLDLARLESGKMTLSAMKHDLTACLQELVRAYAPMAERKQLLLQFQPESPTCSFAFDRDKVEKIISNLLSNAIKFTPEGGKVFLLTKKGATDSGFIEIIVKDTGPGIPQAERGRIFERFERMDTPATRREEGMGVGLALVKELVDLHEGTIRVESEEGFGSTFVVRLPTTLRPNTIESKAHKYTEQSADLPQNNAETELLESTVFHTKSGGPIGAGSAIHPPYSVLLVEDNDEVRAFLRSQLEVAYKNY